MKLLEMRCKNCGAIVEVDEKKRTARCEFCGTTYQIEDESKNTQYDNSEQAGYEFEKGRIRAQNEQRKEEENKPPVNSLVRVEFPIRQLLNTGCTVFSENGRVIARCKQGEAAMFNLAKPTWIVVKMNGWFGTPKILAVPGRRYAVTTTLWGTIEIKEM